jgi:C1A family cysteine protease/chitodextrinase
MNKLKKSVVVAVLLCFSALAMPTQGYTVYAAGKNTTNDNSAILDTKTVEGNYEIKNIKQPIEKKDNYGVRKKTKEDQQWIDKNMIKTKDVSLNSTAIQRRNLEIENKLKADSLMNSINGAKVNTTNGVQTVTQVPVHVDNSELPAFPPIRTQGSLGSCASFATTYYQMSYTTNLARGLDAKNDSSDLNKCSPKWTYNFVNFGQDLGSFPTDNYRVMQQMGVDNLNQYPYIGDTMPITNYTSWPTKPDLYKAALNNRIDETGYVNVGDDSTKTPITSPNDSHLKDIKTLLANGKVLTFTTYINSWNFMSIKDDPSTDLDNSYVGQTICGWQNNTSSGHHCMTIVGYDDNIWTDINNNGKVDPGEKGAFKIANSWGDDWGNKGFMWVAYDALNTVSMVKDNPSGSNRSDIFEYDNEAYWISVKSEEDKPKVTAEITLNTAKRNSISVEFTTTDDDGKNRGMTFTPYMLAGIDGEYSFDGTTNACDGTFDFDISSIIDGAEIKNFQSNEWVVNVQDTSQDGQALVIKDFKIIDNTTSNVYSAQIHNPISLDGSSTRLIINPDRIEAPKNLHSDAAQLTSLHLAWDPSTTSSVTGYDVYSWGTKIGTTSGTDFTVTNLSPNSSSSYSVKAHDANGNYSLFSESIDASTAKDTIPPTTPTDLECTSKSNQSVNLIWKPSTDNYNVSLYYIYRIDGSDPSGGPKLVGWSANTTYTDTSVKANNKYIYYINAYDGSNYSPNSNKVEVTTDSNKAIIYYKSSINRNYIHYGIDGVWTSVPGKLMSDSYIYPGYKEYKIDLGSSSCASACFDLNGGSWDNNNSKNYTISDGRWKIEGDSNTFTKLDSFGATAPSNLSVVSSTDSSVNLTWQSSEALNSYNIAGYGIYRNGQLIGTTIGDTSFADKNISISNSTYSYYVRALDKNNNPISDASNIVNVGNQNSNIVTIYYKEGYSTPYIHYCIAGGKWTNSPGILMPKAEIQGYNKISIDLGKAQSLQACFNNGVGQWDNNSGKNYNFSPGTYTFLPNNKGAGIITKGAPSSN